MTVLLAILYLLAALGGAAVALTREPRRQVLAISVNGMALALLFFALQAPDVAFSEIVVGGAALPLMFLVTLANARARRIKP
jgi:energy-converting hydrogenase B subunit D